MLGSGCRRKADAWSSTATTNNAIGDLIVVIGIAGCHWRVSYLLGIIFKYRSWEVTGPGDGEGLVCRDSRAEPAAAAATGPSLLKLGLLGPGCRTIRWAKLVLKLSNHLCLEHGFRWLEGVRCMALLTCVELGTK